jgi:hypothetical protein
MDRVMTIPLNTVFTIYFYVHFVFEAREADKVLKHDIAVTGACENRSKISAKAVKSLETGEV